MLTPLHMWSHCECRVQENSWLAYNTPNCWNYFERRCLWLCHVKGEAGSEQARTNMVCSTQTGPEVGSAGNGKCAAPEPQSTWTAPVPGRQRCHRGGNTHEEQPKGDGTGAGRGGPLFFPKEIQFARLPSPPRSLKRLPCPHKVWSVRSIDEDHRKKASNQLMLWFLSMILNIF